MTTKEMLEKLTSLMDEYEESNDNIAGGLEFIPVESRVLENEYIYYVWNGEKMIEKVKLETQ